MTEGRDALTDVKVMPGHSKGLGITEGPREELDSRLLGMQENGPGSGADSLLG